MGKCSIYSGCSFSRLNLEKEHPLFLEHFVGNFLKNIFLFTLCSKNSGSLEERIFQKTAIFRAKVHKKKIKKKK